MEAVAAAAGISRPGLYFLFGSKEKSFRFAVMQAISGDLAAAEEALMGNSRPLAGRLLAAFDHWAGRYVGTFTRDVSVIIADNPGLLGPEVVDDLPHRFYHVVEHAVREAFPGRDAAQVTA